MNSFNVLDRKINIHKNYLLEASAGTGKTFSIENIVVRLLIEENPENQNDTLLDQILVVTFTRASTRDLNLRIRSALEACLTSLRNPTTSIPDYMQVIIAQGQEKVDSAIHHLENALAIFDQAQIYTIHGFCLRMLTSFSFESDFHATVGDSQERSIRKEEIIQLIRNFFRTEIRQGVYSPTQLQIILNSHKNRIENVQEALLNQLNKDCNILPPPDFSSSVSSFNILMHKLKNEFGFQSEKLGQDFDQQIDCYKAIPKKTTKPVYEFFNLFDQHVWSEEDFDFLIKEGLLVCEFLAPENARKQKKPPEQTSLHYPHFITILQQTLAPLIAEARSYESIFARMVHDCRQLLEIYLAEEEKYRENDLLKNMQRALYNPSFLEKVRHRYHVAIIDEFQDTDPIQWEIFRKLFLDSESPKQCKIYLVGDPKQSIYAFRQADIYTYLSAAQSFTLEHQASIDTNYRSQPSLVKGLNILFQACPKMFSLPSLSNESKNYLDCPPVKIAPHAKEHFFSDQLTSIHFYWAKVKNSHMRYNLPTGSNEEEFYFPFIAQEIMRLHNLDGFKFNQFAVLIKNKFQAQRLAHFFDRHHIPYSLQKQVSLTDSLAWNNLKELLLAVLHPKNENYVKIALGGQIIGWNYHQIKLLNDPTLLEKVLAKFFNLKRKLVKEGFGSFFHQLMRSSWHSDELTVIQKLLEQEKGEVFLDELNQIAALLIEYQSEQSSNPERLFEFLTDCQNLSLEDETRLKKFSDPTREAVSILTIHNSKGLEYEVVFAQGLLGRHKVSEQFIPQKEGLFHNLVPCVNKDSELYLKHCEELDAEKMRQLYVAMTRAKYRLYLPVATIDHKNSGKGSLDLGAASPMDLFLARLDKSSCNYQELYQRIEQEDGSDFQTFLSKYPENYSYTLLNEMIFSMGQMSPKQTVELIPPEKIVISVEPCFIQSFTALSKSKGATLEHGYADIPHDFDFPEKNAHTLPSGSLTGKLLHKILEDISFSALQNVNSATELTPWIQPFVANNHFSPWEKVICEMIYKALHVPLKNKFCLTEINPFLLYRETEFLFPYEIEMQIEEVQWHKGFLKGVMDLVFCHNNLYYLIDWKSNWLGKSVEDYTSEKMIVAMQQNHYYMQARIYQEALKRYLKLVDTRPFEEIYGGCFYIFLRGLNGTNQSTGILSL